MPCPFSFRKVVSHAPLRPDRSGTGQDFPLTPLDSAWELGSFLGVPNILLRSLPCLLLDRRLHGPKPEAKRYEKPEGQPYDFRNIPRVSPPLTRNSTNIAEQFFRYMV